MNVIMYSDQFFRICLQGNLIERFSKNLTNRLGELVHSKSILWMVDILGNPLECSCDTRAFQAWVRNSTIIANVKNLTCGGEVDHRIGHTVLDYDIAEFYCKWITLVIVVASDLIAMILSSPLCICFYRNCWYVSHIKVVASAMVMSARRVKFDLKCKYDAFVFYDC